jgi:DNA-binding CsgD family transcriptional regulator
MLDNDERTAIEWGTRALDLARRLGDVDTELHAMVNIGTARQHLGDPAGAGELHRAYERAAAAGLDDHAGRALVNLATVAADRYDLDTAEATMRRVHPFLVNRDLDGYLRHMLGHRARIALVRGDWESARDDVEQALTGPLAGAGQVPALAVRATLRARRGDPGAAEDAAHAVQRGYRTGEIQFVGPAALAMAELHWLDGDVERAAAEARHGLAVAEKAGHEWFLGELAFWLRRCGGPAVSPGAATPFRLLVEGDWRGAAAEWAARGCLYPRAEALSCGDEPATAEALHIYDRVGAVRPARRLRAVLRERGLPVPRGPRPATAADASGLTGRQQEVLVLLAEGLSNADIAARLTLSAKTVDHHVSAVLGKLGVSSRGRAAAAARERGLL